MTACEVLAGSAFAGTKMIEMLRKASALVNKPNPSGKTDHGEPKVDATKRYVLFCLIS